MSKLLLLPSRNFGSTVRPIIRTKKQPIRNPVIWCSLANQQLSYKKNWHVFAQRKIVLYSWSESRFRCLQVSFGIFCWSVMITSIRGCIHQGHEAFLSILEAVSVHLCHLQLCFSIDHWTQTNIDDILHVCHGDCMYLHALTNKMVPDANSLSIEELPEVATSHNNVEYRLNYNKFYQGHIDRSFCGDAPFCSLKQVLIKVSARV